MRALAPDLEVLAPVRDVGLHPRRLHRLRRQARHPDHRDARRSRTRSTRTSGAGPSSAAMMEDPWVAPPDDVYAITRNVADAPREPRDFVVGFERGRAGRPRRRGDAAARADRPSSAPSSAPTAGAASTWSRTAGSASRAARPTSAPAARADPRPRRPRVDHPRARPHAREGPPRAALRRAGLRRPVVLAAQARRSTRSSTRRQQFVTGEVRLRLEPGRCFVDGRRAERGLYDYELATYDAADTFRHEDAEGFVRLWGLSVETWSRRPGPAARRRRPRAGIRSTRSVARPVRRRARPTRSAFTVSLPFDRRLAPDDIAGSRAHVAMLARGRAARPTRSGDVVLAALDQVEARARRRHVRVRARPTRTSTPPSSGGSPRSPGAAGAKLHTGRSRNDQVATDLRLFLRREGTDVAAPRARSCRRCCRRAPTRPATPYLPGYTHLQRAQPVLLAHHLLAHVWALRPRRRPLARCARRAPTCRRSAPARSPARACRSIPTASPPTSGSRAGSTTRSTRCPTATSWPRRCSSPRSPRCTSPASARRSCCGRARSSASSASPTRTPPGRRCCRRRRTPTSPSWRAARPAASSATSPASWPR